jgi:hypothetical protein
MDDVEATAASPPPVPLNLEQTQPAPPPWAPVFFFLFYMSMHYPPHALL